jgi:hypothetical protein
MSRDVLTVVWLLEELGLEYSVKVYARLPTRAAPPELKQANPFGKVSHSSYSLLPWFDLILGSRARAGRKDDC